MKIRMLVEINHHAKDADLHLWTSMHLLRGLMAPQMLMVEPATMYCFPTVHDPNKMVFPVTKRALSP